MAEVRNSMKQRKNSSKTTILGALADSGTNWIARRSVSNNIAEGFERGTTNELLAFIYIARGSAGEVRSMLCVKECRAKKANWPADLNSQISDLKSIAENCSRQLRGWADSLQNSEIKGQRHLTAKSKYQDEQKKRAATVQKDLLERPSPNHPLRGVREVWSNSKNLKSSEIFQNERSSGRNFIHPMLFHRTWSTWPHIKISLALVIFWL